MTEAVRYFPLNSRLLNVSAEERLGSNLGPFLQMLGNGHTVDQALSTHNVQPEAFYAEWERRIGAKAAVSQR